MCLYHRRTAALQFLLQRAHYIRMVVSHVVNAISRQEIDDALALRRQQLRPGTAFVPHIHLQQLEKPHPLRIDPRRVTFRAALQLCKLCCCTHNMSLLNISSNGSRRSMSVLPGPNRWKPKLTFPCWSPG